MKKQMQNQACKARLSLVALVAAGLLQPVAVATDDDFPTFTYTTVFDATFDSTLTAPFFGTGSLSYNAPSARGDGFYDWTSFSGLTISLNFPGLTTFTQLDLTTAPSAVNIHLVGGNFFFSNDNGADPTAVIQGSTEFVDATLGGGTFRFGTEPYLPGQGPLFGGGVTSPLFILSSGAQGAVLAGTYGVQSAVPEASTYAAGGAMAMAVVGGWLRSRRQQS
jgi:hypothetical protein